MEHSENIEEQILETQGTPFVEIQLEAVNWLAEVDRSSITRRVADGSYVVQKNGLPYHVPNSEDFADFFSQLDEYASAHPEAVKEERPHVPTEEEKITALKSDYEATVERWLAAFAATRGYKVSNMGAYANSTNPTFKAEALYYIELQDRTWEACYEILNAVLAGTRPVPTKDELYAELPVSAAQWPTPNPTAEQAAAL